MKSINLAEEMKTKKQKPMEKPSRFSRWHFSFDACQKVKTKEKDSFHHHHFDLLIFALDPRTIIIHPILLDSILETFPDPSQSSLEQPLPFSIIILQSPLICYLIHVILPFHF